MRRDPQRLRDILEGLDSLPRILGTATEAEFLGNESMRFAVAQRLTVVGEAAGRLSQDVRRGHPEIPWADIIALRNILVHDYFGIHWPFVWTTASEHAPKLKEQVLAILQAEFPEE